MGNVCRILFLFVFVLTVVGYWWFSNGVTPTKYATVNAGSFTLSINCDVFEAMNQALDETIADETHSERCFFLNGQSIDNEIRITGKFEGEKLPSPASRCKINTNLEVFGLFHTHPPGLSKCTPTHFTKDKNGTIIQDDGIDFYENIGIYLLYCEIRPKVPQIVFYSLPYNENIDKISWPIDSNFVSWEREFKKDINYAVLELNKIEKDCQTST